MTGGKHWMNWHPGIYNQLQQQFPNKQAEFSVGPSRSSVSCIEDRAALNNWGYRDPPVLRSSRLGANWRHLSQCCAHSGNHLMFVDGMVKQVDAARYPPYGHTGRVPIGFPLTVHAPTQQLRQLSQFVQQKHGGGRSSRRNQELRAYDIGQQNNYKVPSFNRDVGPYANFTMDPFSAYQLGVQDGYRMSQSRLHTAPEQPVPATPPASRPPAAPARKSSKTISASDKRTTNSGKSKIKPYTVYKYKKSGSAASRSASSRVSMGGCSSVNLGIPDTTLEPYTY